MTNYKWGFLFFGFLFAITLVYLVNLSVEILMENNIGIHWANLGIALLLVFAIQDFIPGISKQASQNQAFFSNLRDTMVIVLGTLTTSFVVSLPNLLVADGSILASLIYGFIGVFIGSVILYLFGSSALRKRFFR